MSPPPDLDALSSAELKALVTALLERVAALGHTVTAQRGEIARLKGVPGRPVLKPSGMENATQPKSPNGKGQHGWGGKKTARRVTHEDRVVKAAAPAGSRFKGYEDFVVQDLVLRPHVVRYRRERWLTLDGQTITAPMPVEVRGLGAELRRFVLVQHHQGQVTVARLLAQLRATGLDLSKRQVMRLLIAGQDGFIDEAHDVLRAGQFDVGRHALCWVHAQRLVHKLDTFTDLHRMAQDHIRGLIWWFCSDLKAYRADPTPRRRTELRARFERIFNRQTGFATLDQLLERLHANKPGLLMVLDRSELPLHTNGSENDIRCQVTKRKASRGTRSDIGRDCRDAFLSLAKTCSKLRISFWNDLSNRLAVPGCPTIPHLPDLVSLRCRMP